VGHDPVIPAAVLDAYALTGPVLTLGGGTVRVARVGDVVIKPVHDGTLEHPRSLDLLVWLAEELESVEDDGFRLARALRSQAGTWIVMDESGKKWSAWTYLDGEPLLPETTPAPALDATLETIIDAIYALHRALRHIPRPSILDRNTTPWGVADRYCWHTRPAWIHPEIEPLADQLYARLEPIPALPRQIIHSDLNLANILIAPGKPPGFIDFTPIWAPVDFTVAMFANWLGPRRGDVSRLRHFARIPHFGQLLLRAAIRMLLIVSELRGVADWREEQRAAELVLAFVNA
jgi:hypothetical protein